jgi:UDP-glucose 4-epimerase
MSNVLLTGGLGYIGSHIAVVLALAGYEVVLYDNLTNSRVSVLDRLESVTGKRFSFVVGDVRDTSKLAETLKLHNIKAVIHLAGLKAVGVSVNKPIEYYDNNVVGALCLLKAMQGLDIKTLVFSSSATVYGDPQYLPLDEEHPTSAYNPYGRSKLYIEEILADVVKTDATWRVVALRYFNPVGAHESGLIGEDPNDLPNNLMPCIAQVAFGRLGRLNVFGNDYDTLDGTGVRDYVHVMDLAEGHSAALRFLEGNTGLHTINLGTGTGYSVLDIVNAFEVASQRTIPYTIAPRRMGDVASCYSKVHKAKEQLGWQASRTLEDMCESTIKFHQNLSHFEND